MSNKLIGTVVALGLIGIFLFKPDIFSKPEGGLGDRENNGTSSLPSLMPISLPALELPPIGNDSLAREAWTTLQNYLVAAKAHDLQALKEVSHQISPTCADEKKQAECFALMDSVSFVGSTFKAPEFIHIESDSNQVVIFTDGPDRKFIYFTRVDGTLKILGINICADDATNICIKDNIDKTDGDADGWWNSTEALFR